MSSPLNCSRNSWINGTMTVTNVQMVKVTYYPHQKTRAEKWMERARTRADDWLKKEMETVEARENARREHGCHRVSNSRKTVSELELSWWSLGRATEDMDDPKWRTWRNCYDKCWCGLTVSHVSPYERQCIETFLSKIRKKDHKLESWNEWEDDDDYDVGEITNLSCGIWFRNVADHNAFVMMLESIPPRRHFIELDQERLRRDDPTERLLKAFPNKNFKIIQGSQKSGISIEECSTEDLVTVQLIAG